MHEIANAGQASFKKPRGVAANSRVVAMFSDQRDCVE